MKVANFESCVVATSGLANSLLPTPDQLAGSTSAVDDIRKGANAKALWRRAVEAQAEWRDNNSNWAGLVAAMDDLFDRTVAPGRYPVLRASIDEELLQLKLDLLSELAVPPFSRVDASMTTIRCRFQEATRSRRPWISANVVGHQKISISTPLQAGQIPASVELSRIFGAIYDRKGASSAQA